MESYAARTKRNQPITRALCTLQQPRFVMASPRPISADPVSTFPLQSLPHFKQVTHKNLYKETTALCNSTKMSLTTHPLISRVLNLD